MILLFRSEVEIEEWCRDRNRPRGETLTLAQVWELSQAWYHNRMSPDFRGRSIQEAHVIFERIGLTSDFWKWT